MAQRTSKKKAKRLNACTIARTVILALAITFAITTITVTVFPINAEAVNATENGGGSVEYANTLMSGNSGDMGGWNENLLQEFGGSSRYQGNNAANGFITSLNDFMVTIAWGIGALTVVLTVARFVGRAAYEISAGGEAREIPVLFLTGEERKGGRSGGGETSQTGDAWIMSMVKDTFKYFLIAFGVWTFLSILAGVILFGLDAITSSAPDEVTHFNVGSVNVTTN